MFRSSRPDGPPRPPAALAAVRTTRRPMGTDVATIDAASEVEVSSTPTFSDLVTARAGNVTVSETSGNVGAGARVRIRELDSLAQENDPLLRAGRLRGVRELRR